jgi:hypothetical protein
MRLRNDVRRYNFAYALPCRRTRIDRTADRGDITSHDRSDEAGVDLFPTDQTNVRSFHHCISRFDHRYQSATFNHSECFWHQPTPLSLLFVSPCY